MDHKKKILLVTDSLGLARHIPETTWYEDTYASKLSEHYQVYQYSVGYACISDLMVACDMYLCQYRPDIVILQAGIVDCAPRAYTKVEDAMCEAYRIPRLIRKIISKTISTRKFRSMRRVVFTNLSKYESCCKKIRDIFPLADVYAIGILPPSDDFEKVNPGIRENVSQYNEALKNIFGNNYIWTDDIPSECTMSDMYHLNADGHDFIYRRILNFIE